MPVKGSKKKAPSVSLPPKRSRSVPHHREVRRARHFILTFISGAVIGSLLAFLSFSYLPLIKQHHQTRRPFVYPDPYTVFLRNSSSRPWGEDDSETPDRTKRIFCLVFTITPGRRLEHLRAVQDTWASKCDGLRFVTDRRLPGRFPSFVPALASGANSVTAARGQYGALKTAISYAPFSSDKFDFYLLVPDTVFVAMYNLRELLSHTSGGRAVAWGLVTRSYVPGEGQVVHLSGRAGLVLSDAARRLLIASDCGWSRQAADAQLSLCLRRLGVPQRHVSGFHPSPPSVCATAPPPPPPGGLLGRLQRWAAGRPWPRRWRPCPPRAVTFGGMNLITLRRTDFFMNLGIYGRTGGAGEPEIRLS